MLVAGVSTKSPQQLRAAVTGKAILAFLGTGGGGGAKINIQNQSNELA